MNVLVINIIAPIITGLAVVFITWIIKLSSQPTLELTYINQNAALIKNNSFRTVVFGSCFALEQGYDLLYPLDGFRGQLCELECPAHGEVVVGCAIRLGESVTVTYKPLSPILSRSRRYRWAINNQARYADVVELVGRKPLLRRLSQKIRDSLTSRHENMTQPPGRNLFGWKIVTLTLHPA